VSSGIGLATAKFFIAKGWIVVGTVRGRARAGELRALQIDLQPADMVRPRDLERVVKNAWRTYGRIDALVCNAGYGLTGPIDTLDYARMTEQLAVNLLGPAELIRHAAALMRRQNSGVIIGVSSMAGRAGFSGYSMYSASKFGLEGLLESLAMELAVSGVQVKLVEPSNVDTPFWAKIDQHGAHGATVGSPGQGMSPEKVAATIFLAATDNSSRLRYPLGQTAWLGILRKLLPERLFLRLLRKAVTGN
jgi:NAD(P)-dependent dehydrogenase (short-subunit alcohol dehydrogenase family)